MERRSAIKSVFTGIGVVFSMPSWANNWNENSLIISKSTFNKIEENTLIDIVATIIPDGELPGAKSLGVPILINKIVTDCFDPKQQTEFKAGLESVEKVAQVIHNQKFENCDTAQKLGVLKALETSADPTKKAFFTQIRNLTVQGYTSSEYVLTKHLNYNMAPGHYYGCVPV